MVEDFTTINPQICLIEDFIAKWDLPNIKPLDKVHTHRDVLKSLGWVDLTATWFGMFIVRGDYVIEYTIKAGDMVDVTKNNEIAPSDGRNPGGYKLADNKDLASPSRKIKIVTATVIYRNQIQKSYNWLIGAHTQTISVCIPVVGKTPKNIKGRIVNRPTIGPDGQYGEEKKYIIQAHSLNGPANMAWVGGISNTLFQSYYINDIELTEIEWGKRAIMNLV